MSESPASSGWWTKPRFLATLAALLALYLGLQVLYTLRLPLVMDEFQGAAAVYRLGTEVPYRDFQPYKTVLGYYAQLPVLLLAPDLWSGLLLVKLEIALLVVATLAWAAVRLTRRRGGSPGLHRGAVLLALLLLVTMSTFLERSAELRVDMLTAAAGLVSLVFLLEGRRRSDLAAGAWAGVAVLVSQKGVFFPLAGGAALALQWLRHRDARSGRSVARYVAAGLAVGAAYFLFWTALAGGNPLAAAAAPSPRVLAADYELRAIFWPQTLLRNPVFYLAALWAWAVVAARAWGRSCGPAARGLERLAVFSLVLLTLCLWYPQPWPYFFVFLLPTLWILQARALDLYLGAGMEERRRVPLAGRLPAAALVAVLVAGAAYPLASRLPAVLARDNAFQRYNLELADYLLAPGETYLAGVDMLWDRRQLPAELGWIDRSRQLGLRAAGPAKWTALMAELESRPPKLLIWNYRLSGLPAPLRNHLLARYRHVVANLFLPSPAVVPPADEVRLDFSGRYLVEMRDPGQDPASCHIAGRAVAHGTTLTLEAGSYPVACSGAVRFTLLPPGLEERLVPGWRGTRRLFPTIYSY